MVMRPPVVAVADGGAIISGNKVTDSDQLLSEDDVLPGGVVLLRRGRKAMAAGRLATS